MDVFDASVVVFFRLNIEIMKIWNEKEIFHLVSFNKKRMYETKLRVLWIVVFLVIIIIVDLKADIK